VLTDDRELSQLQQQQQQQQYKSRQLQNNLFAIEITKLDTIHTT